jgi:hypothetical protein
VAAWPCRFAAEERVRNTTIIDGGNLVIWFVVGGIVVLLATRQLQRV